MTQSKPSRVIQGDVVEAMAEMAEASVDAVLTDSPYGIRFMGKAWDGAEIERQTREDHAQRSARKDGRNVPVFGSSVVAGTYDLSITGNRAFQSWCTEWATAILRVLKPGGFLLAFGGTRTFHRLTCAIEDAGFEIRDCLMWLYGSGFPKSTDVSKQLDAKACREELTEKLGRPPTKEEFKAAWKTYREVLGKHPDPRHKYPNTDITGGRYIGGEAGQRESGIITAPATPAAKQWSGYGTAMKPSWEPCILAQKPLTIVPQVGIIQQTNELVGAMLCLLLSSVRSVESVFRSSRVVPSEASASVGLLVALLDAAESGELSEKMDTFNSPETVLMCLSIATRWSGILAASLNGMSTFTTETATALTTALAILNSCISANIPADLFGVVCQADGCESNANTAASNSSGEKENSNDTLNHFVRVLATLKTAESGTPANTAAESLRRIIPSVNSVLKSVTMLLADSSPKFVPDWRPMVVAMKPLDGTFAQNALAHGLAGINVDGARVNVGEPVPKFKRFGASGFGNVGEVYNRSQADGVHTSGRWPANAILSHHPECVQVGVKRVKGSQLDQTIRRSKSKSESIGEQTDSHCTGYADADGLETVESWDCHPDCPVGMLDEQSGVSKSGEGSGLTDTPARSWKNASTAGINRVGYSDTGTASRFFYCAKSSRRERNAGCEGLEAAYLATMGDGIGKREHNPGQAAAWVGNAHPTVKPLALCKYLATLILPPQRETPRVMLDCFCGSGSLLIGAILAGWDEVIGIEKESEYVVIANARLKWWQTQVDKFGTPLEPDTVLADCAPKPTGMKPIAGQMDLFE